MNGSAIVQGIGQNLAANVKNGDGTSIYNGTTTVWDLKGCSGQIPLGSIIATMPHLTGAYSCVSTTAADTKGFVLCGGQTISDVTSPMNGAVIPNINDDVFLMGAAGASSNTVNGSNTRDLTHTHSVTSNVSATVPAHYHGIGTGAALTAAAQTFTGTGGTTGNPNSGSALESHTHAIQGNPVFATAGTAEYVPGGARGTSGGPNNVTHTHTFTPSGTNSASNVTGTIGLVTGGVERQCFFFCNRNKQRSYFRQWFIVHRHPS